MSSTALRVPVLTPLDVQPGSPQMIVLERVAHGAADHVVQRDHADGDHGDECEQVARFHDVRLAGVRVEVGAPMGMDIVAVKSETPA